MLPRAELYDPRALAQVRRPLRALAWWRSPSLAPFVIGHCLTAGALQLGALLIELARAGKAMPTATTITWAAIGLAMIAAIPVALTLVWRTVQAPASRAQRLIHAGVVGVAFYAALPWLALGGGFGALALLAPVAVAWHLTLAGAPRG